MSVLIYLGIGCICTAVICLSVKICEMIGIDASFVMVFVFASILFAIIAYCVNPHIILETPKNTNTQIESEG